MATARLADRRIREAASQAALRLDVRGPVSEALGRAGVVVPPAAEDRAPEPASRAETRRPRPRVPSARRVVKPFEPAPWPTRRRPTAQPEPETRVLSGLTADERRVHRILIDTLDLQTTHESGLGGLSYGDRKKLEALDLAFIDQQIEKLTRREKMAGQFATAGGVGGAFMAMGVVMGLVVSGDASAAAGAALAAGLVILMAVIAAAAYSAGGGGRIRPGRAQRRVYDALRELALLVEDADPSDALAQADALIDRIALDDLGPDDLAPADGAPRARVRS